MLSLQEIEDLLKSEEFAKSVNRAALTAFLNNAAILRDPKSDKETKAIAQANINNIAQGKKPKKITSSPPITALPKFSALQSDIDSAESKINEIYRKKNAESIARQKSNIPISEKQSQVDLEARQKKEFGYSEKELQAHANRVDRDPKAWAPKEPKKELSPERLAASFRAQAKAKVDKAINLATELHSHRMLDDAHKILSNIPKEHWPQNLADYDPTYIHYDVTPKLWQSLSPEHRNHVKAYHEEVIAGHHDDTSDPAQKAVISKVKGLNKPKIS